MSSNGVLVSGHRRPSPDVLSSIRSLLGNSTRFQPRISLKDSGQKKTLRPLSNPSDSVFSLIFDALSLRSLTLFRQCIVIVNVYKAILPYPLQMSSCFLTASFFSSFFGRTYCSHLTAARMRTRRAVTRHPCRTPHILQADCTRYGCPSRPVHTDSAGLPGRRAGRRYREYCLPRSTVLCCADRNQSYSYAHSSRRRSPAGVLPYSHKHFPCCNFRC